MEEPRDVSALVGRRLGEFVVREPMSSGGFGMVFRAEQPALQRPAVIKVLHTRLRASETLIQRFLREARLASRLDHPFAAHIYAFGAEPDGVLWIAMELVRGTPLDKLLEAKGPISLERYVPFLERLCQVVQTAHEQGIVHRDLKPANVMVLVRAGQLLPKLLDLGIAKLDDELPQDTGLAETQLHASDKVAAMLEGDTVRADHDALAATAPPPTTDSQPDGIGRLTEQGTVMGSPMYMAPEQWTDAASVDGRTDIYALGVLSYEALTGTPPFTGVNRMMLAVAHAQQPAPPLGKNFPPALDAVLARALAKKAADRYGTALELAAAFRTASGIADDLAGVPRLDDGIRIHTLARAPQPIAQAALALDAARNLHQVRDAAWHLVRVAVRTIGVIALAAHAHLGGGGKISDSVLAESLRRLRQRTLPDVEWLAIARELSAPFREVPAAYPVPELIGILEDAGSPLDALLALREDDDGGGGAQVQAQVERLLPLIKRLLQRLDFLCEYQLVVPTETGLELWMGIGRGEASRGSASQRLQRGQPALLDADGVPVLSLWPFVQMLEPAPGVAAQLFFLEGKGRRGARLVALPDTYEHEDEPLWEAVQSMVRAPADVGEVSSEEVCPYPGLSAFTAEDATRFFGREREVEAFVNRLRAQPLLAVVGPSGAGKSSFVQAGVVPALPDDWRVVTMRPGPAPLVSLAARLQHLIDPSALRGQLAGDAGALGTLLSARAGRGTTVIVVDQLEELFTLCDDEAERERFAEVLMRAARSADDPVRVVFTLRDDFLLRAEALPALRARLAPALHLLTTPGRDDLLRILREPLTRAGYELDDPSLATEMVAALADARSALALLSFTGSKLWELRDRKFRQITRKAYRSLGGVAGALAQHAEQTLASMVPEEQRLVREVLRHAVTAEGTRAVLARSELDHVLGGGPHATAVIEKLVAARLLVSAESTTGEEQIELTHEALITAWPRLVAWRREDAEGARLRDQLRSAARQWDERGRVAGLLWRGDALAEYRLWRARHPGTLTTLEAAFAAASLADATRESRRRTALVAGAFALLATGVVALLVQNATVASQRERAQEKEAEAKTSAAQLRVNLETQYEDQGRRYVLDGDPSRGLAFLDAARQLGATGPAHDLLVAFGASMLGNRLHTLAHPSTVRAARYTRDGRQLITAGDDERLRIWDPATGEQVREIREVGAEVQTIGLDVSPDGQTVMAATTDGQVSVWRIADGERVATVRSALGMIQAAVLSPDGRLVATATLTDEVELWDVTTGARVAVLQPEPHAQALIFTGVPLAFSPDGARLGFGDNGGVVRIWDVRRRALVVTSKVHAAQINTLRFSPDGARLVTASNDATAAVLDATARPTFVIRHEARVNQAEFSPDGARIATASNDRSIIVADAATGTPVFRFLGHQAGVNAVEFRPGGDQLASVGDDATVMLWNLRNGGRDAQMLGHTGALRGVTYRPDSSELVTYGDDATAIMWRARAQIPMVHLAGHQGFVYAAAFSPDSARVVTAGGDGTVRIWDRSSGALLHTFDGLEPMRRAAYSPDGRWLAAAGRDGIVWVWNATTYEVVQKLVGHTGWIWDLAWLPDSQRLVSAGNGDATARVWSIAKPEALVVYHGHREGVVAVTVDPRGETAVTASQDNTVQQWDLATGVERRRWTDAPTTTVSFDPAGRRLFGALNSNEARIWSLDNTDHVELRDHRGTILTTRWSPDGDYAVTSSIDATIRLWNPATGVQLASLRLQPNVLLWSVAYAPDGRHLVTTSDDGTATVWELPAPVTDLDRLMRCQVPLRIVNGVPVSHPLPKCT